MISTKAKNLIASFELEVGSCTDEYVETKEALENYIEAIEKQLSDCGLTESARHAIEKHRIALTPEYEGGWYADIYEDSEEILYSGYGDNILKALENAFLVSIAYED